MFLPFISRAFAQSGESEWMWLPVDRSDDDSEIVLGRLDSQPVVIYAAGAGTGGKLRNYPGHRKFD